MCDADEALRHIVSGEHFDVILCDVMMAGISGQEFFERLHAARSELADRVVFITGGATNGLAQRFLDTITNERLDKPFDLMALRAMVARVTA